MPTKNRKRPGKPKRRRRAGAAAHRPHVKQLERRARDAYLDDDDPEKALELLQQAEANGPLSDSGLDLYLDVVHSLKDIDTYARIALTMVNRHPDDPQANMLAGSACYSTMQPISAIIFWEKLLELDPSHRGVSLARPELTKLRKHLPEILDAFIDDLPKDLPRVASVENILHFLKLGRLDDAIRLCRKHLRSYPDDFRIRNNLAESLSLRGDNGDALEVLDETIQRSPENYRAHAARSRVLYFLNRRADSEADARKLRTLVPKTVSDLTKAAQSFAFRGDEAGIEWAYELAEQNDWLDDDSNDVALLLHYQATRLARADQTKAAKSLWKRAKKIAGPLVPAESNLIDLRKPIGERNGPFYFELGDWLSQKQQTSLGSIFDAISDYNADSRPDLSNRVGEFIRQNDDLERLAPDMLDRGDHSAIQFATVMARYSSEPDIQAALRAFVVGHRGADSLRHELGTDLHREGFFDSNTIEMYVRGKRDRIEFIDFEITEEATFPTDRDDDLQQLMEYAVKHLYAGEGVEAEELLRQAIQDEPDAPDIKNNLAMALQLQDRFEEADQLLGEVIERHPDYFFGQIAVANRALQRSDFDDALETLAKLQRRKRLHGTEFAALANAMVYTFVGRREFPSAERWLHMLRDYDPKHPSVDELEEHIRRQRGSRSRLSKLLERF